MSHTITIQPDGIRFTAEDGETILEAALRAGVALEYNCNNGNCGRCIGWCNENTGIDSRHHDFRLPQNRDGQKPLLMCRTSACTDIEINAAIAWNSYDIPHQVVTTRVYKMENLPGDIMILTLRTPRSQTLQFLAGQYVELSIDGIGKRFKSVASCPCNGMFLQFHFRRRPDDPFSEHIFSKLGQRQAVNVSGPMGDFTFSDDTRLPVLFIACETGFAPIKSIIEHAISLELEQPLHLYWLTARPYQDNYCRSWEDALENFSYHHINTGSEPENSLQLEKLHEEIAGRHPSLANYEIYMNGPETRFEKIRNMLVGLGAEPGKMYIDRLPKQEP